MSNINEAQLIATRAHKGQKRASGEDYINHPRRVAESVKHLGEEHQAVAWLHDVVEDTDTTLADIRGAGFSDAVVDAVNLLTKREGQEYVDFIQQSKGSELSRLVKIADVQDNLRNVDQYKPKLRPKYEQALQDLQAES